MILWCALSAVVGMLAGVVVMALCASSGRVEWEHLYQMRIAKLQELLKANTEELDRWHTDTLAAPPDEDDGCEPGDRQRWGAHLFRTLGRWRQVARERNSRFVCRSRTSRGNRHYRR